MQWVLQWGSAERAATLDHPIGLIEVVQHWIMPQRWGCHLVSAQGSSCKRRVSISPQRFSSAFFLSISPQLRPYSKSITSSAYAWFCLNELGLVSFRGLSASWRHCVFRAPPRLLEIPLYPHLALRCLLSSIFESGKSLLIRNNKCVIKVLHTVHSYA